MNYDYVINLGKIETSQQEFDSNKNNLNNKITNFERTSYSNNKLQEIYNSVCKETSRVRNAGNSISDAWSKYLVDTRDLEGNLENFNLVNVEAPLEFMGVGETGGITPIVDHIILPVLNGERDSNKYYGYRKTADAFVSYIRNGHNSRGQCVEGFVEFLEYQGIYDDMKAQGLHVNWAEDYWTDPKNKEIISQYFDIVEVSDKSQLQDGDWLIYEKNSNYAYYSHVGMYYEGKVFGKNQENSNLYEGGNAFTLNNTNLNDLGTKVHVYRLKEYNKGN